MPVCLSFRKSLMYKCHGNKLFLLNKTNTVFHISCFLIFLMQRKKKANVKQLKANIFYGSNLAVCIFLSSPLWIFCATAGSSSRNLAWRVDVHTGKVWAADRCPCTAITHQTLSTLSVEMAHVFSMADMDMASKGQFRSIHLPLIERLQAVPAEDQTLSLSYFYLPKICCKTYMESLPTICPSLFCFPSAEKKYLQLWKCTYFMLLYYSICFKLKINIAESLNTFYRLEKTG